MILKEKKLKYIEMNHLIITFKMAFELLSATLLNQFPCILPVPFKILIHGAVTKSFMQHPLNKTYGFFFYLHDI